MSIMGGYGSCRFLFGNTKNCIHGSMRQVCLDDQTAEEKCPYWQENVERCR